MAQSAGLHEPEDRLTPQVIDRHRALASVQEELEAVDWYDQRVAATTDKELAEILGHNRDEEKEHAMMVLEWLRRHDPVLDQHMRTYLFTNGSIVGEESEAEGRDGGGAGAGDGSLAIGSLKEARA
ncbi:MAG TPA: ferritin-like domain-containing protein [Acidimicrobiales bacterium]|nr:ferritin-like domain-containing protein [Acidimicrobiales bacterium]